MTEAKQVFIPVEFKPFMDILIKILKTQEAILEELKNVRR